MKSIHVENLIFDFEDHISAEKYDDWSYYKNNFIKIRNGIKAVDLLVFDGRDLYLVEVKDYRQNRRTKLIDIGDEFARKVFDTLAALLPASQNAREQREQAAAHRACRSEKINLVLHLEQPTRTTKLFPRAIDPANIRIKLKQKIKAIDARPIIAESTQMHGLPWVVRSQANP